MTTDIFFQYSTVSQQVDGLHTKNIQLVNSVNYKQHYVTKE